MKKRASSLIAALVTIAFLSMSTDAVAQKRGTKSTTSQITKITSAQFAEFMKGAKGEEVGPLPMFKVAAISASLCVITADGIECNNMEGNRRCPDEIDIRLPDGGTMRDVPIDCVGPDADGNCECEPAGGQN